MSSKLRMAFGKRRTLIASVIVFTTLVAGTIILRYAPQVTHAFTVDACYDCSSGTCVFRPGGGCDTVNASSVMSQDTTTTYSGQTFTVSWNANSVTSCTEYYNGSDGSSGTIGSSVQGSASFAPTPVATTNYTATIDCSGPYSPTSASVTHTVTAACPADTPYTDSNATNISNYCGACPAGYHEPSSITCHTGGTGTWQAYGAACTAPNCTGCGCIANPPPTNGSCAATHYNCSAGTSSGGSLSGNIYSWSCLGANGGSTASCTESVPCPADTPYTESNSTTIANYCSAQGVSCGAGYMYVTSLSCHTGGTGTWRAYGNACTAPNCGGCGCVSSACSPIAGNSTITWSTYCSGPISTVSSGSSGTINNTATGYTGSINYSCYNTAWTISNPICGANSCSYSGTLTWGTACSAAVSTTVASGNSTTVTNTAAGYTGSTAYSCYAGAWTQGATSCNQNCAATAIGNCSLPVTASGGTSGSCSSGYTGACNFTCTNGTWSQNSNSCAASCTLPWGGTIASGSSVTAYQTNTVTSPSACSSVAQSRTCSNGTLSGTYTNQSCSVNCAATTISNCSLPVTASGASAGSCSAGYAGACNFSCSSGTWTQTSNSCVVGTTAPTVTTSAVSSITSTGASSGGTINSNGGATITVSGIVWDTAANPTTALATKTTDGWAVGGPWTDSITGLAANTTYHVRAYATNSVGTSYGSDVPFTTASPSNCAATTISNCSLSTTASGGTSGSCAAGYGGSCLFTCNTTTWSQNSNTCSPAPTATLSASPSTIPVGQASTLTWGSINATSCTAAGGFSTGNAPSGSASVSPSTTSTYSVTCSGTGGTSNPATATVSVLTPTLSITSAPDRLQAGQSTTLTWNATNVSSCTITKNGAAWRSGAANGSQIYAGSASDTVSVQTKYIIRCTDTNGVTWSTTATTLVNVGTSYQEF